MNDWRLTMAPRKCGQITFSRARGNEHSDELKVKIYGIEIPVEINPKFLGVTMDRRLNFEKYFEIVNKKIIDRMNILKILSFDKNWRLNTRILIRMYKALVRSVLDYAFVTSIACNKEVVNALEVIQNDALRVIYKKTVMDHVRVEDLRKWAGVEPIKDRHENLLTRYYERALISGNPLMALMFDKYSKFKRRGALNPELTVRADNSVDLVKIGKIVVMEKIFT